MPPPPPPPPPTPTPQPLSVAQFENSSVLEINRAFQLPPPLPLPPFPAYPAPAPHSASSVQFCPAANCGLPDHSPPPTSDPVGFCFPRFPAPFNRHQAVLWFVPPSRPSPPPAFPPAPPTPPPPPRGGGRHLPLFRPAPHKPTAGAFFLPTFFPVSARPLSRVPLFPHLLFSFYPARRYTLPPPILLLPFFLALFSVALLSLFLFLSFSLSLSVIFLALPFCLFSLSLSLSLSPAKRSVVRRVCGEGGKGAKGGPPHIPYQGRDG
ncbi:MAG: hypothetical protein BJ554DRAFT_3757 [Olpidium bornovanus]|uniref:Uncharacterized protein n=1 Tax=Olpidium bornovanus TaxID=278681 RepID=A0A8H7ZNN3_9FUNG|nr:MAG: hypothetical protein BJ554DRAFT_3757 [Olpidium bornovanus]